jgi:hypothetical protein
MAGGAGGAFAERGALCAQRRDAVVGRIVERGLDLGQGQAELAADHDLLQAQQIVVRVQAIARRGAQRRHQQAELVVVPQRAHR